MHAASGSDAGNPAILSAAHDKLFTGGAVAALLRQPAAAHLLLPGEAACVCKAAPKRIREFTAGRLCARRALSEFGIGDFPLLAAADRTPIWPGRFVGSITHTGGLAVAVVAERSALIGVGIDSEIVGDVTPDIWGTICRAEERAWIESLPPLARAQAVTLVFAVKEAYYKCQYPLTGEWLGFHDLRVTADLRGTFEGVAAVSPTRAIKLADVAAAALPARFIYHEQFVSVGVSLPAHQPALQ